MSGPSPEQPRSPDRVARLTDQANSMLGSHPAEPTAASAFIDELESLPPGDLVRFDEHARAFYSGVFWRQLPDWSDLEQEWARVLAVMSPDGYLRERAIRGVQLRPLTARLLVVRCIDWVAQVRDAALDRLDGCSPDLLVAALPLAEQLADRRARGQLLGPFLDAHLSDADLRRAYTLDDPRTRRAAWRRLVARNAVQPTELREIAARDEDVIVRSLAARSLDGQPDDERRALANVLIHDRVGSVAVPALSALVKLDGTGPILAGLTSRTPALRRAARDWAALRGVDARGVYQERLSADPSDAISLTALAELGDPDDAELFRSLLADRRPRVRAAGLRAVARVERAAGRRAAVDALQAGAGGRLLWTAASVLREGTPNDTAVIAITGIALDFQRTPGQRLRAMSLLRPARWAHLAALLEARERVDRADIGERVHYDAEIRAWVARSGRIGRGPTGALRSQIERLLPTIDAAARREIEFVLRTAA